MKRITPTYTLLYTVPLLLIIAFILGCGNSKKKQNAPTTQNKDVPIDDTLKTALEEFAHKPRMKGNFALYVYDLTAQKPVYGYNENLSIPSASCLKLLSGVAGLHLLGTRYAYPTYLFMRGKPANGVLNGDITLAGGLDPQFDESDMQRFAQMTRKQGITKINGKLIANLLLTSPIKSEDHWYPWDLSFSKYSMFYKGSSKVLNSLKAAFRAQGISVADSNIVVDRLPKGSRCIYRYYRPITFVTERMFQNSSNTQATSLLFTIGHRVSPHGNYAKAGVNYLRAFLRDTLNMKDTALVVHDGCGLCTYNHLSTKALVAILKYAYSQPEIYKVLMKQLPLSGVNGTLRREMASEKLRGKIHAKTGTLSHPYGISSLAGYCTGRNGHQLAFSIMDSDMSVLDARVLQKKLCEVLIK